jgi:hypothetical protein
VTLTITGEPGAAIDTGIVPSSPWGTAPGHALAFRCRSVYVSGLTIRNYQGKGAAIRLDTPGLAMVQDVVFEDISTTSYPSRTGQPVTSADDVWYGVAIGGRAADIVVDGCTFRRVATSDAYAHCIYPSVSDTLPVRSLTVTGCTFEQTGQAVVTSSAGVVRLSGNTYRDTVQVPHLRRLDADGLGIPVWVFWVMPPASGLLTATGETFADATFRWFIRSAADPSRHYFNHNDYSGVRLEGDASGTPSWALEQSWSDTPGGRATWDEWRAAGFDQASKEPEDAK